MAGGCASELIPHDQRRARRRAYLYRRGHPAAADREHVACFIWTAYFQITTAIGGGAYTETDVEYQHHVYATFTTSSLDEGTQVTLSSFLPLQGNSDPQVAFQQALKAGTITVVGHQSLNGRDTILIRVNTKIKPGAKLQWAPSWIWIDASTYLVVQTKQPIPHFPSASGGKISWRAYVNQVTWLSPSIRARTRAR